MSIDSYYEFEDEGEDEVTKGSSEAVIPAESFKEVKITRKPEGMLIQVPVGTTEEGAVKVPKRRTQLQKWQKKRFKVYFEDGNVLNVYCPNPKNIQQYLEENGVKTTEPQWELFQKRFYDRLCKSDFISLQAMQVAKSIASK
jgi:hypothetical protein